jgi:hypothetical protein
VSTIHGIPYWIGTQYLVDLFRDESLVSILAFALSLYWDVLLRPQIRYSVKELDDFPGAGSGLSLAVRHAEVADIVGLKHCARVALRSSGWTTASEVELRVQASDRAVIVQVHVDNRELVEKLPDLGRQGSSEVFVAIRRMVPVERVAFTFWYGYPGSPEKTPPRPAALLRHADALGRLEGAP